jgi:hypothetical protein
MDAPPYGEFAKGVLADRDQLKKYFRRRMRWYRILRTIVIVATASVPVFAAIDVVPRWVLGALGAVAATAEGIQQLYQLRLSALNAMRTANDLEREWTAAFYGTGAYATAEDKYLLFVERAEQIRREADRLFLQGWQRDSLPAVEGSEPPAKA